MCKASSCRSKTGMVFSVPGNAPPQVTAGSIANGTAFKTIHGDGPYLKFHLPEPWRDKCLKGYVVALNSSGSVNYFAENAVIVPVNLTIESVDV